jgi:hypothetical protein
VSDSTELVILRLGLIAVVFLFALVTALTMRSGLRSTAAVSPGRAQVRGPRFVVVSPGETGLSPGAEFSVAGEMSLGRDPGNGIVLGDASVSGVHATLERVRDGWRLTDLGSTNGTMLNGRRVDGRGVLLRGGERVSFGAVVLRFQS